MAVGLEIEVKVVQKEDLKNLQDYKTVVEAKDEGWGITEKEQNDGQNGSVKQDRWKEASWSP